MSTETFKLKVSGLPVEVVRKKVKNLHLGVYPPNGRVRVAAPRTMSKEAVRVAVVKKLGWIKKQQKKFSEQSRQSEREMVSGESHYYLGKRYKLEVVNEVGPPQVSVNGNSKMWLKVPGEYSAEKKEHVLKEWYRMRMKELIPGYIDKWAPIVGVAPAGWQVRQMKTKWGSCNTDTSRITLNLELIKKPLPCFEYVLVHELVHLHERTHNARFVAMMDKFLPGWRQLRAELNRAPLGHADWTY